MKLVSLFLICGFSYAQSQNTPTSIKKIEWTNSPFEQKVFVENLGQYSESQNSIPVKYRAISNGVEMYISEKGIIWKHNTITKAKGEEEREERERLKKKNNKKGVKITHEKEIESTLTTQSLSMEWVGANPNVSIETEDKAAFYYTFNKDKKNIKANAFSKIILKNLYDGIDVEYVLPKDKKGIKYNIIVKQGADISKIKMKYNNSKKISFDAKGNILIQSEMGEFIDHAPITFLKNSKTPIASKFKIDNNEISFDIKNINSNEEIVIDPWISSPTFVGSRDALDVNYDDAGNVFAYGSSVVYELVKMDNTGSVQWIYSLMSGSYAYGDFAVDEGTGISYIGEGKTGPTLVHKISPSGFDIAQSIGDPDMNEFWRMEFNKKDNNIIIAGGSGSNQLGILDTFMNHTSIPIDDNDMVLLAIDKCGTNNCYVAGTNHNTYASNPLTIGTFIFTNPNGYAYPYGYAYRQGNGFNGMAVSSTWLYTYDGVELKRWDKATGAFINNFFVPGGTIDFEGGLDVDDCENIYIGAGNSVQVFDQTYSLIATYPLPGSIFDLKLHRTKDLLYACGQDFVTSINLPPLTIAVTQTATCSGSCIGKAVASISGNCIAPSYSWSPGGMTTATVTGLCAGNYTVEVTVGCLRVMTQTLTITSIPSPTLIISPSSTICAGSSATLTVIGATAYTWSPAGSLSSVSIATVIATPTTNTTYTVIGANGSCTASNTSSVNVSALPILTISPATTICAGSSATLTANGALTYNWSPGLSLSTLTGSVTIASPVSLTTYSVSGTNAAGCISNTTVVVGVTPNPIVNITSIGSLSICLGEKVTLQASGANAYLWAPSGSLSSSTATNVIASPIVTTLYTLIGNNGICTDSKNIQVTVIPVVVPVISSNTIICLGQSVKLTASGGNMYAWNPSFSLSSSVASIVLANPTSTTIYSVIVSNGGLCPVTATVQVIVNPLPYVYAGVDTTINIDESYILHGTGDVSVGFVPLNGNPLNCNFCSVVEVNPKENTCYILKGVNTFGCEATDEVCIKVTKDYNIYIPNAFTPNGDTDNDLFLPVGYGLSEIKVTIFDRWGNQLFKSHDTTIGWDGLLKGKACPQGVYVYQVEFTTMGGNTETRTGHVTVLSKVK